MYLKKKTKTERGMYMYNVNLNTIEIFRLANMLKHANIPFKFLEDRFYNGYHLHYMVNGELVCSVICTDISYGHEEGLLEIMGLLTKEELQIDNVAGFLTAQDVFNRIENHWLNLSK
jgi:hypothetical protein